MRISAVIVAAGKGLRFGSEMPKQYLPLDGKPVLAHAIAAFEAHARVERIAIVGAKDWLSFISEEIVARFGFRKVIEIIEGGKERQDSVLAGISVLSESDERVLVHDGARPLVSEAVIDRVIDALDKFDGVIPGIAVTDTIKKIDGDVVVETVPRHALRAVQTPQGFKIPQLKNALEMAAKNGIAVTDEATLIEQFGGRVGCVEGEFKNLKITNAFDLKIAELLLKEKNS